jgi:hypothetical protein
VQDPPIDEEALERAIVEYLLERPDARDSLEWIRRWWLRPPLSACTTELLERVLRGLVEKGLLVEHGGTAAQVYGLNRALQRRMTRGPGS